MKIAVLGCGAMGTVIGAYISQAGVSVEMIDNYQAHVDAMNQEGAHIIGTVDKVIPVKAKVRPAFCKGGKTRPCSCPGRLITVSVSRCPASWRLYPLANRLSLAVFTSRFFVLWLFPLRRSTFRFPLAGYFTKIHR